MEATLLEHLSNAANYGRACKSITAVNEVYMREYVQFDTVPTASTQFGAGPRFDYGTGEGTAIVFAYYNAPSQKWGVRNSPAGSSYEESGTSTLQAGVWYCVELYAKFLANVGDATTKDRPHRLNCAYTQT